MDVAATCLRCVQNFARKDLNLIARSFSISSVVCKKDLRPTTRKPPRPKRRVERPREDVSFLYTKAARRAFPYHTFEDAMLVLRAYAQTDENVGVNIRFMLKGDKEKAESINGTVMLPKQFKERKILVFAEGDDAMEAQEAGADYIGGKELIPYVEEEQFEFDYCLSSIEFLPNISHLSKVLRKNMPDTLKGTATDKLGFAIREYKRAHNFRTTKIGFLSADIAKLSFTNSEIKDNLLALVKAVKAHKPDDMITSKFIGQVILTTQYGPGLKLHKRDL